MFKFLILDVDGVLTTGRKFYDSRGLCAYKEFNDRDFTAIKRFKCAGIPVIFLSGDTWINASIAHNRNIPFYHSKEVKSAYVPYFEEKYEIDRKAMGYVGDDIFDIPIMENVGWSACPLDAPAEVQQAATITTTKNSGMGVVAEIFDWAVFNGHLKAPTFGALMNEDKNDQY